MNKGRNMLGIVSLIIALIATGLGAYTFFSMNNNINALNAHIDDLNSYIPPMASAYYDDMSTYSIPYQSSQTFNYNQISYDNRDAFNLTSDSYTIHEPGIYQVTAQYSIEAYDGDFFMIQLLSNGTIVCSRSFTASTTTNTFGVSLMNNFNFIESESLSILIYQYNGAHTARNIFPGGAHNFFTIAKIG
jgi:hypothetical protein